MNQNKRIGDLFLEMAFFLEMDGVAYKPQAYKVAAHTMYTLSENVSEIYDKGGKKALDALEGIGSALVDKIVEFLKTKKIKEHQQLKKKYPVDVLRLTQIEGVGPKMVKDFYNQLKIKTVDQLEHACKENKIAKLPGYKEKTQQNILQNIVFYKQQKGRVILGDALPYARSIIATIKKQDDSIHIEMAGSLRRKQETIGDIDLLATTNHPEVLGEIFISLPQVDHVYKKGKQKVFVRFENGMDGDLQILEPASFGAGMMYFTGNKGHNIELRKMAEQKGWKLNEHGLFKGDKKIASKTEKEIYTKLGLQYVEPEMRNDAGEITLAQKKKLPAHLLSYTEILGDLQMHTTYSDGKASVKEIALTAKNMGYAYIGITDHVGNLPIANAMNEQRFKKYIQEIERINKEIKGIHILKSAEVNILKDGRLDFPDHLLEQLDYVLISVHGNMKMSEEEMTKRIIKAMQNPYTHVLGHPTGRLIQKRPGYTVNISKIAKAAKEYQVALEINANKERLDLSDVHIQIAKKQGCHFVISTDAHDISQLKYMELGIAQARRGGLKKDDVINTKGFTEIKKWFKKK